MEKEDMNKEKFGNLIRQTRKSKDMTGESLSRMCDVNPVFIRKIESGKNLPSLPVFVKLCNALNTSPEYFLQNELKNQALLDTKAECMELLDKTTGQQLIIVRNVLSALMESLQQK